MRHRLNTNKGFTLPELMISSLILGITFVGMLLTFIKCMELSELSRNSMTAIAAAKSKMEEIKNHDFNTIFTDYNNVAFEVTGFSPSRAEGVTYINNSNPDLLVVTISVSWRQKNGRVIGEDTNLNGAFNVGEDTMTVNGLLDSPVQIVGNIYQRN